MLFSSPLMTGMNLSSNLSSSSLLLDLLIMGLSDSWSPKCGISSSANLASCRSQLAMLAILWTRENPEHSLPKASQPGPNKPARNLWKFPELASSAWHLCSRAGDPQATFQSHRANSHYKMEILFSIFSLPSACSGLASCNRKKWVLLCSTFATIGSSVHFPNQNILIKTV